MSLPVIRTAGSRVKRALDWFLIVSLFVGWTIVVVAAAVAVLHCR
jgi:hypothetical protein